MNKKSIITSLLALFALAFASSMIAALAAYCFFDNKPQALQGYYIDNTKQLMLF